MSSFETGSPFPFPSSLPSSSFPPFSYSSSSSPVTPSSSGTSSSSVSRSDKSLLSLAVSSADVGSVCTQASPCILARRRLSHGSSGADFVFCSKLKVPDGAVEDPAFMHCAPSSRPWQWSVHSAFALKPSQRTVVQLPLHLHRSWMSSAADWRCAASRSISSRLLPFLNGWIWCGMVDVRPCILLVR